MRPLNLHVKNLKGERYWLVVHNPQQSPTLETSIASSNLSRSTRHSCSTAQVHFRVCLCIWRTSLYKTQGRKYSGTTLNMSQKQRPKRRLSNTPKFVEETSYFKMLRETKEKAAKQVRVIFTIFSLKVIFEWANRTSGNEAMFAC